MRTMALTSSSTYDDAVAQANDNLVWEGSPTAARAFVEAVRWLRLNRASRSMQSNTQLDFEQLDTSERRASAYLESVDSTATARRTSFARARFA